MVTKDSMKAIFSLPHASHLSMYHFSSFVLFSRLFPTLFSVFIFFTMICKWWQALCRKLAPLGDRILVKRAPKEVQTASGIYLPTDKTKDPNEGTVLAVGPGEKDVTGQMHATTLAVGDKVLLPEYGGMKVKLSDEQGEVFLFRESEILGKFD